MLHSSNLLFCFHGAGQTRGKRNDAKLREDFQTTIFTLKSLTKSSPVLAFWNQNLTTLDNLQIGYNSYCLNYQSTYTNLVLVDTNEVFRYSIASGEDV